MDRPTHHSKIAFWLVLSAATGAFLALQGTLYRLEEALACWLLFTFVFALITIGIAMVVAIYSAILAVLRFIGGGARALLPVRWASPTLHPK